MTPQSRALTDRSQPAHDWGDVSKLSLPQKIEAVREARLIFGKIAAQRVWAALQLPTLNRPRVSRRSDVLPDDLRQFLDNRVDFDGVGEIRARHLLEAYRHWAIEQGRPARSGTLIGRALRGAGVRARKSGSTVYLGCSLRETSGASENAQPSLFATGRLGAALPLKSEDAA